MRLCTMADTAAALPAHEIESVLVKLHGCVCHTGTDRLSHARVKDLVMQLVHYILQWHWCMGQQHLSIESTPQEARIGLQPVNMSMASQTSPRLPRMP